MSYNFSGKHCEVVILGTVCGLNKRIIGRWSMKVWEVEMRRFSHLLTGCLVACLVCAGLSFPASAQSTEVANVLDDKAVETERVFQPTTMTSQWLLQTFKDAFMNAKLDEDGNILIQERLNYWIRPYWEGSYLRIYTVISTAEGASAEAKMRYVNRINNEMVVVRATVAEPNSIVFDHYIVTIGGISKRQLVATSRQFYYLLTDVFAKDTDNVLK